MSYPTDVSAAEKASVAAFTQQVVAAWAYQDADGFADLCTEDATLILPAVLCQNKEEIRTFFKNAFENEYKNTQVTGKPISMRFYGHDICLLITSGGVLAAGQSEVSEAQAIRASWFVVRVDGQWRLAAYQNTPSKRGLPVPGADA